MVHLRSGLVLTPAGGLLARLLPLARLGVCPRFGPGTQAMSWISLSDEIGAIGFLLDRKDISGPVNLTAPEPVTNSAFTAALNAAAGRRDLPWLRVPAPVLRSGPGRGLGGTADQYPGDPHAAGGRGLPVPLPTPARGPVRGTRRPLNPDLPLGRLFLALYMRALLLGFTGSPAGTEGWP